jgi:hypothetical membrane protein
LLGDPLRRAGVLLFVGATQFFIFFTISESLYPGYSVSSQPISDLGATCSSGVCVIQQPSSAIFDATVFLLGLLVFVGAFFIYISRSRLIGGLAALSAWGVMGVAIFPETTGVLHVIVSFIAFFFGALAAISSYRMLRPPLSYLAVVLGIASLVALGIYASGNYFGLGQGGMERLIVYPELIWLLGFGAHMMGRPVRTDPFEYSPRGAPSKAEPRVDTGAN